MQFVNQRTGALVTTMSRVGDLVVKSKTGDNSLAYEDRFNFFGTGWNNKGAGQNRADPIAKAQGAKEYDRNARGKTKFNHTDKVFDDYFKLKGDSDG